MIGPIDLLRSSPASRFKTFQVFLNFFPKCPTFNTVKAILQMYHFMSFFLSFKSNLQAIRFFFLLTAAFALVILNLTSRVDLASLVIMLPKLLKYSTFSGCFWSIIICKEDGCLEILITLVFPHSFPFHNTFQFKLVYQSCPVSPFLPSVGDKAL